jgi:hypothetical protein
MKHIKIFEQFVSINEAEKVLPGGYINDHISKKDEERISKQEGKTYFETNSTNPSDENGSPGVLKVTKKLGPKTLTLGFLSSNYDKPEITSKSFKVNPNAKSAEELVEQTSSVLAKNAAEAKANAFNILVSANQIANGDFEAPVGNLVKAFFEIRKMYPEYMRMNPLFSSFLQGLSTEWMNPQLTGDMGRIDGARELKKRLGDETKKALQEIGVIKIS